MADPTALITHGHRTALKWHRGRRVLSDPAFGTDRICEGMALGASVEIDLQPLADGGFAVLHDDRLDRETEGSGPVAAFTAIRVQGLRRRQTDGRLQPDRVATLADLVTRLAKAPMGGGALLQLDLKCDDSALTPAHVTAFARDTAPIAGHLILSGGDAAAVRRLAAQGLRVGYDPCSAASIAALWAGRDFAGFIDQTTQAMPEAGMIYLDHSLILAVHEAGFDMVAALHAQGRQVDAYTLRTATATSLPLIRVLRALKVDQITTDDPQGIAEALA